MQSRFLDEVVTRHATDGDHTANVLDGWSEGHGNHEQDCAQVKFRGDEVGHRQPGRGCDTGGVDHAEGERQPITHGHAGEDRHQTEQAFAQHGDQEGGQQCRHGDQHGRFIRHQLGAAVTGLAHRHVDGHWRQRQTDGDDDRGDHHRRQQPVDECRALQAHRKTEQYINQAGRHHATEYRRQAELTLGCDDRRDEGKARRQEYRHLALGHQLEQQRADSRGEQRHVGIHPGNQWHQHQGAKGHEQHLRAGQRLAPERLIHGLRHAQTSFCLVPKILSPASPRPGTM